MSDNRVFEISDLIIIIRKKFKNIFLLSLSITIFAILVTYLIPKTYTSSILVKNNFNQTANPLGPLSNQFGGLVSMAGIDLDSSGSLTLEQIEAQILSRDFVEHLSTFEKFDINLLIPKSYNEQSKILSYDESKYILKEKRWVSKKETPLKSEIYDAYRDNLKTILDKDNSFIKIEYRHLSPIVAKETLNLIVNEINNINRKKALKESTETINYLNTQLEENSLNNVVKSINSLTEIELNKLVLANIKSDYTLTVIDSAFIPERKSHPKRSFVGMMIFILSFIFLFLREITSLIIKKQNP